MLGVCGLAFEPPTCAVDCELLLLSLSQAVKHVDLALFLYALWTELLWLALLALGASKPPLHTNSFKPQTNSGNNRARDGYEPGTCVAVQTIVLFDRQCATFENKWRDWGGGLGYVMMGSVEIPLDTFVQ